MTRLYEVGVTSGGVVVMATAKVVKRTKKMVRFSRHHASPAARGSGPILSLGFRARHADCDDTRKGAKLRFIDAQEAGIKLITAELERRRDYIAQARALDEEVTP